MIQRSDSQGFSLWTWVLLVTLGTSVALSTLPKAAFYDSCFADRFAQKLPRRTPLTDLRLWAGIAIHISLLLSTYGPGHAARRSRPVWGVAVAWFAAWYLAVAVVREKQADFSCGRPGKANGISGHAMHYVYYALLCATAPVPKQMLVQRRRNWASLACQLLRWIAVSLCTAILGDTLLRGFHTLRHVVVGAALGVALFAGIQLWCKRRWRRSGSLGRMLPLLPLGAVSAAVVMRTTWLPLSTADLILVAAAVLSETALPAWNAHRNKKKSA